MNSRGSPVQRNYAIQTLYLTPTEKDHWLNRLTSMLGERAHGKGFCHVEICIPDLSTNQSSGSSSRGGGGYISSSIYNGEGVTANRVKTFANPGYDIHTITVSENQLRRISQGIDDAVKKGLSFDAVGMYMAALPFAVVDSSSRNRTFCSKYVTELLQMGGVLDRSVDSRITTPSKLYKIMKLRTASESLVGSVGHKEGMMTVSDFQSTPPNPPPTSSSNRADDDIIFSATSSIDYSSFLGFSSSKNPHCQQQQQQQSIGDSSRMTKNKKSSSGSEGYSQYRYTRL